MSQTYKDSNKHTVVRSLILGALAGLLLAMTFSAGFLVRDAMRIPSVLASPDTESELSEPGYPLLDEVQELINDHFLREQPPYRQRQYDAIRGMLTGLGDRNTFFVEPPVAQSESDALAGTYGGIGVNVQRDTEGRFVMYPFDEGPAIEAGFQAGDVLVAVNGEALANDAQLDAVNQMLRGEVEEGNGVDLTVERDGTTFTAFVPFAVINVPSVQWRVLEADNRLGYIQILRFTSRTPDEMQTALEQLKANSVNALVVDLRDNFGGLLQESIEIAEFFLDGGVILYEVTNENERTYEAEEGGAATNIPLTILVNGGTASASELLAGAIQDRDRGILIGQSTFGKGTIQQIFQLSDDSSVHITSAEWLTPDREEFDGEGLEPDIVLQPDEQGRDIELEEAIRYLQEQIQ